MSSADQTIVELIAFIIMVEQKIEFIKQELAGHHDFDTRIAFLSLDHSQRGYFTANDLSGLISRVGSTLGLAHRKAHELNKFFKKYGTNEKINFQEFVKLMKPKNNEHLAQNLIIRNGVRRELPNHLRERFEVLIGLYILLTLDSEALRITLQSQHGLNFVELQTKTRGHFSSSNSLRHYLNRYGYEVDINDLQYLSNHTSECPPINKFTEIEFREIFSPVDSVRRFPQEVKESRYNNYSEIGTDKNRNTTTYLGGWTGSYTMKSSVQPTDNYLGVKLEKRGLMTPLHMLSQEDYVYEPEFSQKQPQPEPKPQIPQNQNYSRMKQNDNIFNLEIVNLQSSINTPQIQQFVREIPQSDQFNFGKASINSLNSNNIKHSANSNYNYQPPRQHNNSFDMDQFLIKASQNTNKNTIKGPVPTNQRGQPHHVERFDDDLSQENSQPNAFEYY